MVLSGLSLHVGIFFHLLGSSPEALHPLLPGLVERPVARHGVAKEAEKDDQTDSQGSGCCAGAMDVKDTEGRVLQGLLVKVFRFNDLDGMPSHIL